MGNTVKEQKARLRQEIISRERALSEDKRELSDSIIAEKLLSMPEYTNAGTLFIYVSMSSEPDTDRIITRALRDGKRVCVPRITAKGTMECVELCSLSQLHPGTFGIREPGNGLPAVSKEDIDLAVVPCLSCSSSGGRLGRGGGYYDRFLEDFSGAAVLLCRQALMTDTIPTEEHDIRIPHIVTG